MAPDIVHTPDILSGKPRIEGTRMPAHQVGVLIRELDWSHERVCESFRLNEAQVEAALEYYDDHPQEMARIWLRHQRIEERIREQSRAPEN